MWIRHNDTLINLEQVAGCKYDCFSREIKFQYANGYIKLCPRDDRDAHEILDNIEQVTGAKYV